MFTAAATPDTKLVDPLVVMIAEGRDGLSARRKAEILARFGRYDHAGVAVNRHADVYTLGRKLPELLDRRTKEKPVRGYTQTEMFQHDSATMFRFVLRGELTGDGVQELEHAWTTARSILGTKALVVEISGITNADTAGIELLFRMRETGARLNAAPPPESTEFIRSIGIPVAAPVRSSSTWTLRVLRVLRLSVGRAGNP